MGRPKKHTYVVVPPGIWHDAVIFVDAEGVAKMTVTLQAKTTPKKKRSRQ